MAGLLILVWRWIVLAVSLGDLKSIGHLYKMLFIRLIIKLKLLDNDLKKYLIVNRTDISKNPTVLSQKH
jgi:hypothetical protein